jgi:hypothetical protein
MIDAEAELELEALVLLFSAVVVSCFYFNGSTF